MSTLKGFTGKVAVINTATNTVIGTVKVGANPAGIALSSDGSRAYVTNSSGNTVSVIDTANSKVLATVTVGAKPDGVVVSPLTAAGRATPMWPTPTPIRCR